MEQTSLALKLCKMFETIRDLICQKGKGQCGYLVPSRGIRPRGQTYCCSQHKSTNFAIVKIYGCSTIWLKCQLDSFGTTFGTFHSFLFVFLSSRANFCAITICLSALDNGVAIVLQSRISLFLAAGQVLRFRVF